MQTDKMLIKPSIVLSVAEAPDCQAIIREIRAGIEEEGVPCTLLDGQGNDAVALAWQAANTSQLGVGLGATSTGICIHHHKFSASEPLFTSQNTGDRAEWRQYGYNAARLVKGLPFKDKVSDSSTGDDEETQLVEQIRRIVAKIMRECAQGHGEVLR